MIKGILAVLLFCFSSLFGEIGSAVPEDSVEKIIFLDNQNPASSDENPGTENLPLKTFKRAIEIIEETNEKGIGIKLLVHPGTYRESIEFPFRGRRQTDSPIVIEAKEPGKTMIKGSDVWEGWKRHEKTDIYTHEWPYKWGLAPYPPVWEKYLTLQDIVRRKEMLFVNGELLKQVLSPLELKAGCFYVSEEKELVYIWVPKNTDMKKAAVEVALRSGLFRANGRRNFILRGFTFMHDNTPVQGSAAGFTNGSNIIVEDCLFLWNNWGGFGFSGCSNVTARRCAANQNGGCGMGVWRCKDVLFEDNETSYNNWRGARGEFFGWAVAGVKNLLIHNAVYRNHRSVENQTRGFWFDCDTENVVVEKAFWCKNQSDGIFIEGCQGPITIKDSVISFNKTYGVLSNSANVTLENNIIFGNGQCQLQFSGGKEIITKNWETGVENRAKPIGWKWSDNVIAGEKKNQYLIDAQPWEFFFDTLTLSRNLYYNPGNENVFRIGSMTVNLVEWQNLTGQDLDSIFKEPLFRDPSRLDFSLQRNSLLRTKEKWEKIKLTVTPAEYRKKMFEIDITKNWQTPYPYLEKLKEKKFEIVNLQGYMNRPLKGEDAFIGAGSMGILPGRHEIHGVPFEIADQNRNNGSSCIILKSEKFKDYPAKIEIPLDMKAKAVYFLHGCGWIPSIGKTGEYRFIYSDETENKVDIIADDPIPQLDTKSNICDWWPAYQQIEKENAKKVIVVGEEGTRYLYTLQWLNPEPEKKIKKIILESNLSTTGTMGILAVTALLGD